MNKKVITGIVVIVALGVVGLFFIPQLINVISPQNAPDASNQTASVADSAVGGVSFPGGLSFRDEVQGNGDEVVAGDQITVNYTGALSNGTVFDSSSAHGQPFTFIIGQGRVIPGWEKGLIGMKVGGKRFLTIPPEMAYGANAIQGKDASGKIVDVIPANSTLLFEVELLKSAKPSAVPQPQVVPQSN